MTSAHIWTGTIGKELMFVGSKSEGDYFVFRTDSGIQYRLRVLNDDATELLESLMGRRLSIEGIEDDLRGHRRLTITSEVLKNVKILDHEEQNQARSAQELKAHILNALEHFPMSVATLEKVLAILENQSLMPSDEKEANQDKIEGEV
jgi:hypothetical protein